MRTSGTRRSGCPARAPSAGRRGSGSRLQRLPEPPAEEKEDRRAKQQGEERPFWKGWKELSILIGTVLLLALLIKTFLVQAFSIPSDSMRDTLQPGDRVLVDKLTPWFGSEPQRGEIVVFHDPGGWLESPPPDPGPVAGTIQNVLGFIGLMPSTEEKNLIKRVIAVGGDTVECSGGNRPVKVNGTPLDEPYLHPGSTACKGKPFGPVEVPEGRIWVMGDNRQDSSDSRFHQELPGNGTVSEDAVVGRAIAVAWPVSRWSTLPVPDTFDQPGLVAASAADPSAPALVGAVPLVLRRHRRLTRGRTSA